MEFDKRFIGEKTSRAIQEIGGEPIEMTEEMKEVFDKFKKKFTGLDEPNDNYLYGYENDKSIVTLMVNDKYEAVVNEFSGYSYNFIISFIHKYGDEEPFGEDCIHLTVNERHESFFVKKTNVDNFIVINENQICVVGKKLKDLLINK